MSILVQIRFVIHNILDYYHKQQYHILRYLYSVSLINCIASDRIKVFFGLYRQERSKTVYIYFFLFFKLKFFFPHQTSLKILKS